MTFNSGSKSFLMKRAEKAAACFLFVSVSLTLLGAAANAADKFDIDEMYSVEGAHDERHGRSILRHEINDLLAGGDYEGAFERTTFLIRFLRYSAYHQRRAVGLMANIIMADWRHEEAARERLDIALDVLNQIDAKIQRPPKTELSAESAAIEFGYEAEAVYALATAAHLLGEERTAHAFQERANEAALRGNLWGDQDSRERRRRFLRGLSRDLANCGQVQEAVNLLSRHWKLAAEGEWKSSLAIEAMAYIRVAEMLEEQSNTPGAAQCLLATRDLLNAVKETAPGVETESVEKWKKLLYYKLKHPDYAPWVGLYKPATYEDSKALQTIFQSLLDKVSVAWKKQDVEAILEVSHEEDPEALRAKLKELFREGKYVSLEWTIEQCGPVRSGASLALCQCKATVVTRSGLKRVADDSVGFVHSGKSWKVLNLFGGNDEDDDN